MEVPKADGEFGPLAQLMQGVLHDLKQHIMEEDAIFKHLAATQENYAAKSSQDGGSKYGLLRTFLKTLMESKMSTMKIKLFASSDCNEASYRYKELVQSLRNELYSHIPVNSHIDFVKRVKKSLNQYVFVIIWKQFEASDPDHESCDVRLDDKKQEGPASSRSIADRLSRELKQPAYINMGHSERKMQKSPEIKKKRKINPVAKSASKMSTIPFTGSIRLTKTNCEQFSLLDWMKKSDGDEFIVKKNGDWITITPREVDDADSTDDGIVDAPASYCHIDYDDNEHNDCLPFPSFGFTSDPAHLSCHSSATFHALLHNCV